MTLSCSKVREHSLRLVQNHLSSTYLRTSPNNVCFFIVARRDLPITRYQTRVLRWAKICQNRGVMVLSRRSSSQGVAHPPSSHVSMPSMYVVLRISAHGAEAIEEGLLCVFQFSITIVNRGHPIVLLSTRGCDAPV